MKSRELSIPIIVALISLCGVLGAALINNWGEIHPTPTYIPRTLTVVQPTGTNIHSAGTIRSTSSTDTPSPQVTSECVVTIDNPLVPLRREPDQFSQEIIRVKPGDYPTLDYTEVTFVNQERGWFQIEAEERIGWIQNDTWTIADKTSVCP